MFGSSSEAPKASGKYPFAALPARVESGETETSVKRRVRAPVGTVKAMVRSVSDANTLSAIVAVPPDAVTVPGSPGVVNPLSGRFQPTSPFGKPRTRSPRAEEPAVNSDRRAMKGTDRIEALRHHMVGLTPWVWVTGRIPVIDRSTVSRVQPARPTLGSETLLELGPQRRPFRSCKSKVVHSE